MNVNKTIQSLHDRCGQTLAKSLTGTYADLVARSHVFAGEIELWCKLLGGAERKLFQNAAHEYTLALLAVCQGQYRNAFKGLRLVMELCVQGVYLSANMVALKQWLSGERDTVWTFLVGDEGPFGHAFCKAFFPDLASDAAQFRTICQTLYRELSECIHGNIPARVPIPDSLEFDEPAFCLWHEKSATLQLVAHFLLSLRYLHEVGDEERTKLQAILTDQLGHIEAIRLLIGGPATL